MGARFSNVEEAANQISKLVDETMSKVSEETKKLFDTLLTEICQEYQYLQFYKMTENICDYYENDFRSQISGHIEDWVSGPTSLVQATLDTEAADSEDDDSAIAARDIQENIVSIIEEYMSQPSGIERGTTVARVTKSLDEIFEDIDKMIGDYVDQIDECKEHADQEVENLTEENQWFSNVGEALIPVIEYYRSLFDKFKEGAEKLGVHLTERADTARSASEQDRDEMVNRAAEEGGAGFEEASELFRIG